MKKTIIIIISCIIGLCALVGIIIGITYFTSSKLVCKSTQGNITIMYNDKAIKGYTAKGIRYDLSGQQAIAEKIGVDAYLEQFKQWFANNTDGTCE